MDIICISSIDWDFNWQGHQEVMARLARQGNRVLYVENTGVRAPKVGDVKRWSQRIGNWRRGVQGFRQEMPNLFVYSPVILPFPQSAIARRINRYVLSRALRRWMSAIGFQRALLWTFLPTWLVLDLIDELDPVLVVYYCIADFRQLAGDARIDRSERALLDRADVVFVQGEALRRKCLPHSNITIFPFGVNLDAFRDDVEVAPELDGLKRPLVGYVGGVHRHVDFPLLERVAGSVDGTLVLVGPIQHETSGLRHLPNVALVGPQPHERLCEFLKGFDAALIPYVVSEYTETVYPTKLNEYLAMGVPVVSTDLPEVRAFSERHGGIAAIARTPDEFAAAVRNAVQRNGTGLVERRKAVAREHSWDRRVSEMWRIVEGALAETAAVPDQWQERLRRLYRVARRRVWETAGVGVLGMVLLFFTPALWIVAMPLRVAEPVRPAEAIAVFAGGVGESGRAGGGYQERVRHAVDLYNQGLAPRMVFSSGYVFAFQEAEVMRSLAESAGVPPDRILLEKEAANTYENVVFVNRLLEEHDWDTVLLVSSPYHMRRALLTWRGVAPDVTVIAAPVPRSQFYASDYGASLEHVRAIVHEYVAIVWYWWKGWL
jgi:uncharacterized SAM-binding protein YcdF (DUF218 family)/glycosyltransferase involved in cell wall biosynthesis